MLRSTSYAAIGALMFASAVLPFAANAQTSNTNATNANSNSSYTSSNSNANSNSNMNSSTSSTGAANSTSGSSGTSGTTYYPGGSAAEATMPVLYNQSGQAMNVNTTTALPAGYYYLGTGGTHQVYYYGNGTYYDPSTGTYGGSAVNDPNGTAGVSLGYSSAVTAPGYVTNANGSAPGVPNTGAGGDATATWITLAISALIVAGGATYLVRTRPQAGR